MIIIFIVILLLFLKQKKYEYFLTKSQIIARNRLINSLNNSNIDNLHDSIIYSKSNFVNYSGIELRLAENLYSKLKKKKKKKNKINELNFMINYLDNKYDYISVLSKIDKQINDSINTKNYELSNNFKKYRKWVISKSATEQTDISNNINNSYHLIIKNNLLNNLIDITKKKERNIQYIKKNINEIISDLNYSQIQINKANNISNGLLYFNVDIPIIINNLKIYEKKNIYVVLVFEKLKKNINTILLQRNKSLNNLWEKKNKLISEDLAIHHHIKIIAKKVENTSNIDKNENIRFNKISEIYSILNNLNILEYTILNIKSMIDMIKELNKNKNKENSIITKMQDITKTNINKDNIMNDLIQKRKNNELYSEMDKHKCILLLKTFNNATKDGILLSDLSKKQQIRFEKMKLKCSSLIPDSCDKIDNQSQS